MGSSGSVEKRLEGKPVVVIVGAGFSGVKAATLLDSHFNVLLIDRKKYMFHNLGALRASVNPDFLPSIIIPTDKVLKYGHVIQAEVTQITSDHIQIEGREEPINFDHLIVATGTSYAFPAKVPLTSKEELPALYNTINDKIAESEKILIIGGGPVGCELVGEISYIYPDKDITLVHPHDKLLNNSLVDKVRDELHAKVSQLATVRLNSRVQLDGDLESAVNYVSGKRTVTIDTKGEESKIEADLILFAKGARVNSSSYEESFAEHIDENKRLKVNNLLQVEGYENIYAIGDCCNTDEAKMMYTGVRQATFLSKNLKRMAKNGSAKEYTVTKPAMFVPLGPKKGSGQFPNGMVVGDTITSALKGKGLYSGPMWSLANQSQNAPSLVEQVEDKQIEKMSKTMEISPEEAKVLLDGIVPKAKKYQNDHT